MSPNCLHYYVLKATSGPYNSIADWECMGEQGGVPNRGRCQCFNGAKFYNVQILSSLVTHIQKHYTKPREEIIAFKISISSILQF